MAMFEIEDSEDVKLLRCKTDGETLVKGKSLPRLHAEDCETEQTKSPSKNPVSLKILGWIMGIVAAVIAGVVVNWLG
ncbi:hypothetical protein [Pseudomonas inefficax]|uniref:hypothetical protein n=1 Tax=Pseudomonas inefficax TaxID=2078786 RepID=UPI004046C51D